MGEIVKNYLSVLHPIYDKYHIYSRLDRSRLKFSILSNFIALLGGKIKSKQMLSGNMADILSNIYLCHSLVWYYHHYQDQSNSLLSDECIKYLLNDIDYKMNLVITNYPIKLLSPILYPLKSKIQYSVLEDKNELYKNILNDKKLYEVFKNDIYYKDTVLEKMEKLLKLDPKSKEYNDLISKYH